MRSRVMTGVVVLAIGLLVPAMANASNSDQAVAYQLGAAHDGHQSAAPITTPLSQAWSVGLSGAVSYPLVVNGVVYVTAVNPAGGTTLYALEQANGTTLWSHSLGGSSPWSGLAYDAGQVFTVTANGTLTAFDATTGNSSWSVSLPGQTSFTSPPTALNGYVYTGGAGSGGTVYAVDEGTGQVAWSQPVANGDHSSPAVDGNGVYVTYACDQDYAFNPLTGTLIWHHSTACSGGGGKTPVLAAGSVFGRDGVSGNLILSATTGSLQGSFASTPAPAVANGTAYTVGGGSLTAVASSGLGANDWTFTGDGKLDTAPLVVGSLVFEASSGGNLYAVDPSSGTSTWSAALPSGAPAPDEQNSSQPLTGLAAGEGTLVVPTGSTLTAYTGATVGTGTPSDNTAPSVDGVPVVGRPVGADVGTWTGLPTSYSYQWLDCVSGSCSIISGATHESYTPSSTQLGSTLEVSVTATNASGTSSAVVSGPSSGVASPPSNASPPTISGSAAIGQTLSASAGAWNPSPTSYSYQWLRCQSSTCTPVTGASSSTYTIGGADVGSQLEVQVTGVNGVGTGSATSQPTASIGPAPTTVRLVASANPVTVGSDLSFTATVAPTVDGGTVSFTQDGQPVSWCQAMPVSASSPSVTCDGTAEGAGEFTIGATYSGDSAYNASSASLTESIVTASTPAPAATPPSVALQGAPARTSATPTVYYREGGSVTWTLCTIDGKSTPCDTTHAVLPRLSLGTHTFVVQVIGGAGSAHDSVTWEVSSPGSTVASSKLGAPRNLRARRTSHGVSLSWSGVPGARAYRLTVTLRSHTQTYRLGGSARSFTLKLARRQHGSVSLGAVGANGRPGASAQLSFT